MPIKERDVLGLMLVNIPLSTWKAVPAEKVIYEAKEREVEFRSEFIGSTFITRQIKVLDDNSILITGLRRLNLEEGVDAFAENPRFIYTSERVSATHEQINRILRLGCGPGRKTEVKYFV
jgi:hypothetical protein